MASILPPAETQFLDANGTPLALGKVYFYIPNTFTPKDTYQDAAQTILNTNPVSLDAAGRAIIWGNGSYRQILKDALGNTVWDLVTDVQSMEGIATFYLESLLNFDVDPTGVNDSTDGWLDCIATGKSYMVPAGTYKITGALTHITSGQVAYGTGAGLSKVVPSGSFNVLNVGNSALSATQGAGFRDLYIDASGMSGGYALSAVNERDSLFDNIIVNAGYNGLYVNTSNNSRIGTVHFQNMRGTLGFELDGTTNRIDDFNIGSVYYGAATGTNITGISANGIVQGLICDNWKSLKLGTVIAANNALANVIGTAQAGTANSITLAAGSSSVTDYYVGGTISITGGTGNGETAVITAYNGTTKIASVDSWSIATPDNTSTYSIHRAGPGGFRFGFLGSDYVRHNGFTLSYMTDMAIRSMFLHGGILPADASANDGQGMNIDDTANGQYVSRIRVKEGMIFGFGKEGIYDNGADNFFDCHVYNNSQLSSGTYSGCVAGPRSTDTIFMGKSGSIAGGTSSQKYGFECQHDTVTGTAQAGSATTITLAAGASAVDNYYQGYTATITAGTSTGSTATISSYVGATKVATVASWSAGAPDNTSVYSLNTKALRPRFIGDLSGNLTNPYLDDTGGALNNVVVIDNAQSQISGLQIAFASALQLSPALGASNMRLGGNNSGAFVECVRLEQAAGTAKVGFLGASAVVRQSITGSLSTVADAPAKAVLTSIISALSTNGLATNNTT